MKKVSCMLRPAKIPGSWETVVSIDDEPVDSATIDENASAAFDRMVIDVITYAVSYGDVNTIQNYYPSLCRLVSSFREKLEKLDTLARSAGDVMQKERK